MPPTLPAAALASVVVEVEDERLQFDPAIRQASQVLFAGVPPSTGGQPLVIGVPVIGNTGIQTGATEAMGAMLAARLSTLRPDLRLRPFSSDSLAARPWLLLATLTPVHSVHQPEQPPAEYRLCLALADLASGTLLATAQVKTRTDDFDPTPLPLFIDLPLWAPDPVQLAVTRSCRNGRTGEMLPEVWRESLPAAPLIQQATLAYHEQRFAQAQKLFETALPLAAGHAAQIHASLYLLHVRRGNRAAAMQSFAGFARRALAQGRLTARFNFGAGTSRMLASQHPYSDWLREIGQQMLRSGQCLAVVGHSRHMGSPVAEDRLSLQRAQWVGQRLLAQTPALAGRVHALGMGARLSLVGSGDDSDADALDQRIEFRPATCYRPERQ